jgi:hypothetical protein
MTPTGWSSDGIIRYDVRGLPPNESVTIDATFSGHEKRSATWAIKRAGKSHGRYPTPDSALEALRSESDDGQAVT